MAQSATFDSSIFSFQVILGRIGKASNQRSVHRRGFNEAGRFHHFPDHQRLSPSG